jgi:transcriptional regulator of acetoin/glycerol metabolism
MMDCMYQFGTIGSMELRQRERTLLGAALRAHDRELRAREIATRALIAARDGGVPVLQLSKATGIPRQTLIRRLKAADE